MDQVQQTVFDTLLAVKKTEDPYPEALLREDLGFDSMHLVRVITKLTAKLQVSILEFSDQELARVKTVEDLTAMFRNKIQAYQKPR